MLTPPPRFAGMIRIDENGCWIWTKAHFSTGYPAIRIEGKKTRRAHRVAWELCVGPIPEGLQIDHLCRVKSCVNPAHLEPVTAKVNAQRAVPFRANGGGGPRRAAYCKRGHPFDQEGVRFSDGRTFRYCYTCNRMRRAVKADGLKL